MFGHISEGNPILFYPLQFYVFFFAFLKTPGNFLETKLSLKKRRIFSIPPPLTLYFFCLFGFWMTSQERLNESSCNFYQCLDIISGRNTILFYPLNGVCGGGEPMSEKYSLFFSSILCCFLYHVMF